MKTKQDYLDEMWNHCSKQLVSGSFDLVKTKEEFSRMLDEIVESVPNDSCKCCDGGITLVDWKASFFNKTK